MKLTPAQMKLLMELDEERRISADYSTEYVGWLWYGPSQHARADTVLALFRRGLVDVSEKIISRTEVTKPAKSGCVWITAEGVKCLEGAGNQALKAFVARQFRQL